MNEPTIRISTSIVRAGITLGLYACVGLAVQGAQLIGWGTNFAGWISFPTNLSGIAAVEASEGHTIALREDSTVTNWGTFFWYDNHRGPIFVPAGISNVVSVAAGYGHDLVLLRDGTLRSWGYVVSYGADKVPLDLVNVVHATTGTYHSLAIKSDGRIVGWGKNYYGNQATPPAELSSNTIAVACGSYHSLALRMDGTVFAWGEGYYDATLVPPGLSNVVAISAGWQSSFALRSDGTVVGWGYNPDSRLTPPAGLTNVESISAGQYHVAALLRDGTVRAWGQSPYQQTNVPRTLSNVSAVASGQYHSAALVRGGAPIPMTGVMQLTAARGEPLLLVPVNSMLRRNRHQWLFNAKALSAQTNRWFRLPAMDYADAGRYSLIISNAVGAVTNHYDVNVLPVVLNHGPDSRSIYGGGSATFSVSAAGADLHYQWLFNDMELPGQINAQITFTNVLPEQAGRYTVIVSNQWGSVMPTAHLNVAGALRIKHAPIERDAIGGTDTTFTVEAEGVTPFSYQWQFNGADLPEATNQVMTITNLVPAHGGRYSVVVRNAYGSVKSAEALLQVIALRCSVQPTGANLHRGAAVTFSATIEGNSPWSIQWLHNGTNLPGAVNASLALTNLQYSQSGTYSLTVSNDYTNVIVSLPLLVSQVAIWNYPHPQMAGVPGLTNLMGIAAGRVHNLALRRDGTVLAWGYDTGYGELAVPPEAINVIAVAAGPSRSLGLKADGSVVSWGSNSTGIYAFPSDVTNVVAIASGAHQNLALRADGTVITRGGTPAPTTLSNVVVIAVGNAHSIALKDDGTAVAWGANNFGQTSVPFTFKGLVALAAGGNDNLVARTNGALIGFGQSGTALSDPPNGTNALMVRVGGNYSLVLNGDGTLKGKGTAPIPSGLSNVQAIAIGGEQYLALLGEQPPRLRSAFTDYSASESGFSASILSDSGRVYRLEYKEDFGGTNWQPLQLVAGTGRELRLADPLGTNGQRFYRVKRW